MTDSILVLNCGSSSIKYLMVAMPAATHLARGVIERIGSDQGSWRHADGDGDHIEARHIPDHRSGVEMMLARLGGPAQPAGSTAIAGVGHRVVHGGGKSTAPLLVSDAVLADLDELAVLAPLHNPASIAGIRATKELLPAVPQVACFDTSFHATLPARAYVYGLPYELYEQRGIRRYGFHGISHEYVAQRCAELAGRDPDDLNAITCHLGNGCSITAIARGQSIDTSMGFTPLEGLMMGTRSGDIDPAIVLHLAGPTGLGSVEEVGELLQEHSGLLGLSGVSNDVRDILAAAGAGQERAALAVDVFAYRIKKYIGAYWAVLPSVDALVFTGGIGAASAAVRRLILDGLDQSLGVVYDDERNSAASGQVEMEIGGAGSTARVFVIPTDEELAIARITHRLVKPAATSAEDGFKLH